MFSTIKELTVCPRCGSNNIYVIGTSSKEKGIRCAQCGFTNPTKPSTEQVKK